MFGPDGLLYIGTGDGGIADDPERNGQDLNSLLGKILRIDPHQAGGEPYTPKGAPSLAGQGAPEVYSYGLRNPWRFSFDRANDALVIGDVGQNSLEEIDYVAAGRGRGRQLRLVGLRGRRALQRGPGRRRPRAAGPHLRPRRRAARSPAATSSATPACRRSRAATSTATSARASCGASSPVPAGPRATAAPGSRSPRSARSPRTTTAASTQLRSKALCSGSCNEDRPGSRSQPRRWRSPSRRCSRLGAAPPARRRPRPARAGAASS